jgi:hypothetical protein
MYDEPIMVDEDGIPMDDLPDDYPDPPWANCDTENPVERLSCCSDPSIRGGRCSNCGVWLSDLDEFRA